MGKVIVFTVYSIYRAVLRDELIHGKHLEQCLVHRKCYLSVCFNIYYYYIINRIFIIIIIIKMNIEEPKL